MTTGMNTARWKDSVIRSARGMQYLWVVFLSLLFCVYSEKIIYIKKFYCKTSGVKVRNSGKGKRENELVYFHSPDRPNDGIAARAAVNKEKN